MTNGCPSAPRQVKPHLGLLAEHAVRADHRLYDGFAHARFRQRVSLVEMDFEVVPAGFPEMRRDALPDALRFHVFGTRRTSILTLASCGRSVSES